MGFTKFLSFLNPFYTTRKRKHKTRRQKKHKRRTIRRAMRGGWGETFVPKVNYVMKGGWGGALQQPA